ncbi:TRAP transporter large permease [Vineibacter terrae]|uniref:TRAP transporter large permease protein n=1 Tax=Vineibacter terrae TaxID=2586908 RepID=A0A5C8PUQ8_9HYPH|nr:TRAP transporter large permease [Vineibacter terrae]TXL81703.1 TRAP transporter large permease [Vineibacter terrae]
MSPVLACCLLLAALLFFGVPVAFSLAIAGVVGLFMIGGWDSVIGILQTTTLSSVSSYELVAVPMFILMAEFVILSGIANGLFEAAALWVGRVRGGLAMATALAGAGFGAISGSSTASAATLASTSLPAMLRQGYDPKLASGVVAISGTLAMLIPPSVALVLFGVIADISVGKLLIAGVIPGVIVTLAILLTVYVIVVVDKKAAPVAAAASWRVKLAVLKEMGPMLLLFGLITTCIYTGLSTPTEASAIGALGALLLAVRSPKFSRAGFVTACSRAMRTTCMILMIIVGAHIFGYFFTLTRTTHAIVAWVSALPLDPYTILAIILFGYIVLGCVMDQAAILILTVPVVLPVVKALGFDPVWFGVIVVVTAELGMVTPPVGLNVFVVSKTTGMPLGTVFHGIWPHVVAHILVLILLTVAPGLVTWLPSNMQ